ncbi:hypothetical protein ACE1AT_22920 [Pelatocladus sp. BLCC-F211]|uniref:hypothetical protein n=1 Tax=Pelatocladus sp. BLCC-F211 TaxID=3342752 RepID=UPI0035B6EB2D
MLIFATNGPKPEIIFRDLISNKIEIVANNKYCLVYDLPIHNSGITWKNLVKWWAKKYYNRLFASKEIENDLLERLQQSIESEPEALLFNTYYQLRDKFGRNFPALLPQVYLHYDPKTLKERTGHQILKRQRMDFLILFSNKERVVIEVDGKQHYADGNVASPKKYAEMVAADRELRLAGYELYRFGGYELQRLFAKVHVKQFFTELLEKHGIGAVDFYKHAH